MNDIQKKWKELKPEFIKNIPKKFKVSMEISDYEKDDPMFGHPVVKINDDISIRSQFGRDSVDVYGHTLHYKSDFGKVTFSIETEDLNQFYKNIDYYISEMMGVIDFIRDSNKVIVQIQDAQQKLRCNLFQDAEKMLARKKALKAIYDCTEFMENERLVPIKN